MKQIVFTFITVIISTFLFGQEQAPQKFKYQGIVRDLSGSPIPNQNISLKISILKGEATGDTIFTEIHDTTSSNIGLFNIQIGTGNLVNGNFENIEWGSEKHFLQIEIDENGGNDYQLLGISQLLSVPYALFAERAGNNYWMKQDTNISYIQGRVGVGTDTPKNPLEVLGSIRVSGTSTSGKFHMVANNNEQDNWIRSDDENGETMCLIIMGDRSQNDNFTIDIVGNGQTDFAINQQGNVGIGKPNPASKLDVNGAIKVDNGTGSIVDLSQNVFRISEGTPFSKVLIQNNEWSNPTGSGFGEIILNGKNNLANVAMGGSLNENEGFICIYDENGNQAACFGIQNGESFVGADVKNFWMDHPLNPEKEIWYACPEGPEAAAYERGTASLSNGEAFVEFSDHFKLVANHLTMTVQITPHSSNTYGVAVIDKNANGFNVKEFMNGTGNFSFDWEVKCVRKGYEDFQVIRDKKMKKED